MGFGGGAGTNRRHVALPRAGGRVGPTGVWLQRRLVMRRDGNSLDPNLSGLKVLVLLTMLARSSWLRGGTNGSLSPLFPFLHEP
jgi:hypothetical protein